MLFIFSEKFCLVILKKTIVGHGRKDFFQKVDNCHTQSYQFQCPWAGLKD